MPAERRSAPVPPRPLPLAAFHILVALAERERHGYAIMQDVEARTSGALRLSPGTLYGSIKRMLEEGLIEELDERPDPENDDERRRYYRITARGRRAARDESARLTELLRQARATGLVPRTAGLAPKAR
ncbi:MAG TPA: PadR family transcriptional regulator [Verrucomicrobiae bacterium]|nr:PadR family transcriptional regulator [Verrucomicrobiae bacterium]